MSERVSNRVRVVPEKGAALVFPGSRQRVPAEGIEIDITVNEHARYWRRRAREGSARILPAKPKKAPKSES